MNNATYDKLILERARRTAFISRLIVLREGRKSKAHRAIEMLEWSDASRTEELLAVIRDIFIEYGDNMAIVDRDLKRALAHADRLNPLQDHKDEDTYESHFSLWPLIEEYNKRACSNFVDALFDYERSNKLLFGEDGDQPKLGGWRLPGELLRNKQAGKVSQKIPKSIITQENPVISQHIADRISH